jgi:hypothetical protein
MYAIHQWCSSCSELLLAAEEVTLQRAMRLLISILKSESQ